MTMSIAEYARAEGISVQRARQLAREGKIPARMSGRVWIVEDGAKRQPASRRPLSPQSQADLIEFLSTRSFGHVSGHRKRRLAQRLRMLRESENPAALLRDYFVGSVPSNNASLNGGAIVRAALKGNDEDANIAIRMNPRIAIRGRKDFAVRVREARMFAGLTTLELAAKAKVSERDVQLAESGSAGLEKVPTALRISDALALPVSVFTLDEAA